MEHSLQVSCIRITALGVPKHGCLKRSTSDGHREVNASPLLQLPLLQTYKNVVVSTPQHAITRLCFHSFARLHRYFRFFSLRPASRCLSTLSELKAWICTTRKTIIVWYTVYLGQPRCFPTWNIAFPGSPGRGLSKERHAIQICIAVPGRRRSICGDWWPPCHCYLDVQERDECTDH